MTGKEGTFAADMVDRLRESHGLIATIYLAAAGVVCVAGSTVGTGQVSAGLLRWFLAIVIGLPALALFVFSIVGLAAYLLFLPSGGRESNMFGRVHATQLLHPMTTALVAGLFCVSLVTGASLVWATWGVLLFLYILQTALIMRRLHTDYAAGRYGDAEPGFWGLLWSLMLGGELVTLAVGAKPIAPWRIGALPPDTWIVDVRTKPEYRWNRLQAAENYPWGQGLLEAAKDRPRDRPVLVTCFSGHRSPAVATMLRRMGFTQVYNLNWGILYLLLLQHGRKQPGAFSLTQTMRDTAGRGEDLKGISVGYVSMIFLMLIGAPLESLYADRSIPVAVRVIGVLLGLGGLTLCVISYRALGRNFRVFAAPRRSGKLITGGIYRRVRHPMYTGVILGMGGYVLAFGSPWFAAPWLAMTVLYLVKAVREEGIVAQRFAEYHDYRRRTWRFVPFIH